MNKILSQTKRLVTSSTAKETYILFAGNFFSFVFGIIFAIFAARSIDPSGWGVFTAAGGMMIILFAFSELGLSSGLFRFVSGLSRQGKERELRQVSSVILSVRLVSATLFLLPLLIFGRQIAQVILKSGDARLIYLTAFGLIGSLLIDFQISLLQAKGRWKTASFLTMLTNLFRFLLIYFTAFRVSPSLVGLFAIFFLSPILTFTISIFFERPRIVKVPNWREIFKNVSKFSLWMGVNRSVGSISSRVDSVLILQLAGSYEAGLLGAARQLSNAAMVLLGSFATVIAQRFASYKGASLKKYYKKTTLLSFILGLGLIAGIFLVDPVISLLGPKYQASADILKWLLVGLIPFAFSNSSVNALIYAFHRPKLIAMLSVIQLPLIILANIILIPKYGIYGPVIVIGIWNLSTLIITFLVAKKEMTKSDE